MLGVAHSYCPQYLLFHGNPRWSNCLLDTDPTIDPAIGVADNTEVELPGPMMCIESTSTMT